MSKSAFYASKESLRLAHDQLFKENLEFKKLLIRWEHFHEKGSCLCDSCLTIYIDTKNQLERKAAN